MRENNFDHDYETWTYINEALKYENSIKYYVWRCDNILTITVTISFEKHWWLMPYP